MSLRHHVDSRGNTRNMHGWRRQHYDPRDRILLAPTLTQPHPPVLSLRSQMPSVRDQGNLGSCTANAGVVMTEHVLYKETGSVQPFLSRLDLYAITRDVEGTPLTEDSGCNVRDVCRAMARFGVCLESTWPYDVDKFSQQPPKQAMTEALHHRATSYHAVVNLDGIRQCIVDGYSMIFGFDCFESLMSDVVAQSGCIPLPGAGEASVGGHCVTLMGYDDHAATFEIQNSWGTSWGLSGRGWLPYEYLSAGLASDFWTLRRETTR